MAISPDADPPNELPYLSDSIVVDEEAAGTSAHMKWLRPRDSGSMTDVMRPVTYILYCNIAGQYVMGMSAILTVTG